MPRKQSRRAAGRKGGLVGGRSRSPAKVAAVRENGKLGGRPKKNATDAQVKASAKRMMVKHAKSLTKLAKG